MNRFLPWVLFFAITLSSCAKLGWFGHADPKNAPPEPFGPTGIPPQLRSKASEVGTAVVAGGNVIAQARVSNATPEEDIVFTNPDDPEATVPELATVLSSAKRGPWEESETIAKQRSVREGKPLLIWFTDSSISPMCKALSQELFSTNDFGNWAAEKLVRLRVDSHVEVKDAELDVDSSDDRRNRIRGYVSELEKRYKVMGHPTLIVLSPSGEVVGRYHGYKRGGADYLWGQIKHGEAVSTAAYQGWRAGLEKKGYRDWWDRKGHRIFAKLTSYSKESLMLIEPDGSRARTQEVSLSDKDRAWIAEQKKLRGIE
jgi:thioredoxin-related protein